MGGKKTGAESRQEQDGVLEKKKQEEGEEDIENKQHYLWDSAPLTTYRYLFTLCFGNKTVNWVRLT